MALHEPHIALAVDLAMGTLDDWIISYFRHINFRLNVHNMGDGTRKAGHRNVCYYVAMEIIR